MYTELGSLSAVVSGNTGPRQIPFEEEVPAIVESTIGAAPHLECLWGIPNNHDSFIVTAVAEVTNDQAVQVTQALIASDFTGISELGSVRYVKEFPANDGFGPRGYSIIVLDGFLFATEWVDWGPSGYTADIVNTVLGPAA